MARAGVCGGWGRGYRHRAGDEAAHVTQGPWEGSEQSWNISGLAS